MRKIVGFRLPIRPHEVKRRAKRLKLELPPEPELQLLLEKAGRDAAPAVLFETFKHPDPDQPVLSPMTGLAYSVVLATLGERFDSDEGLMPAIRGAAVEEAVRFAAALIEEEAAKDACALSPITPLEGAPALEAAVRKLEAAKIGVRLEDGRLRPAASAAVSLSWLSKSKAKGKPKS